MACCTNEHVGQFQTIYVTNVFKFAGSEQEVN